MVDVYPLEVAFYTGSRVGGNFAKVTSPLTAVGELLLKLSSCRRARRSGTGGVLCLRLSHQGKPKLGKNPLGWEGSGCLKLARRGSRAGLLRDWGSLLVVDLMT